MRWFLLVLFALCVSCTEPVPAGHIGRTWEASGFTEDLLAPGRFDCWNRCRMYLMETTEQAFEIPQQNILCADNLNFKFSVNILVGPVLGNKAQVKEVFTKLIPSKGEVGKNGATFTVRQLFEMYIQPVAVEKEHSVVSAYKTSEIVEKRAQIIAEYVAAVREATKDSVLEVKRISVGNFDFPEVVTQAQEAKAKAAVEIETAANEATKRVAMGQADVELAGIRYRQQVIEAQTVADYNKIIGASISPQYLAYKQLEIMGRAADGENNMIFIPYTETANGQMQFSQWTKPEALLDSALLAKVNQLKQESNKKGALPLGVKLPETPK